MNERPVVFPTTNVISYIGNRNSLEAQFKELVIKLSARDKDLENYLSGHVFCGGKDETQFKMDLIRDLNIFMKDLDNFKLKVDYLNESLKKVRHDLVKPPEC